MPTELDGYVEYRPAVGRGRRARVCAAGAPEALPPVRSQRGRGAAGEAARQHAGAGHRGRGLRAAGASGWGGSRSTPSTAAPAPWRAKAACANGGSTSSTSPCRRPPSLRTGNWAAPDAQQAAAAAARPAPHARMNFKLDIADSGALLARFGMKDVIRRGKGTHGRPGGLDRLAASRWTTRRLDGQLQRQRRERASSSRPTPAWPSCSACSACSRCRAG